MAGWRLIAALAVTSLVLLSGCGAVSTPTSAVSPNPATTQPPASPSFTTIADANSLIRMKVTGAHPLTLPTAIPAGWRARINTLTSSFFNVTYVSPDGSRTVEFAIEVPNPPPPGPLGTQAFPKFHGDRLSLYQVADKTQLTSERWLIWNERGTWAEPNGLPGVPYFIFSTGLTNAEFWTITNSVHA